MSEPTTPSTTGETHVSPLALERLAAGDLAGDALASARAHLGDCAPCAGRLAALELDTAGFAARGDHGARLDAIAAGLSPAHARRSRRRYLALAAGIAGAIAAAGVLVALEPGRGRSSGDIPGHEARDPHGHERRKGGAGLTVIRRSPDGRIDELAADSPVHPGDAVRFRVSAPEDGFVGVLGIDAAGVVSPYAPAGPALEPIAGGPAVVLDGSIILDDTLGPERIVAVFCAEARLVDALLAEARAALARADGDPLGVRPATSCPEVSLVFTKAPR
jgi:hypothetical protein